MKFNFKSEITTTRTIEELPPGTVVDFNGLGTYVLLKDDFPNDPTCVAAMVVDNENPFILAAVFKEHREPVFRVLGRMDIQWGSK